MLSCDARNTAWVSFDGRKRQEICHGDRLVHIPGWSSAFSHSPETLKQSKWGKTRLRGWAVDKFISLSSCLNTYRLCYVTLSTCLMVWDRRVPWARASFFLYVTHPKIISFLLLTTGCLYSFVNDQSFFIRKSTYCMWFHHLLVCSGCKYLDFPHSELQLVWNNLL